MGVSRVRVGATGTMIRGGITQAALFAALATGSVGLVGCDAQGEPIGPRGGVLVSDDGRFSLDIPARALDTTVELSIEEVECEIGDAIGACYAVHPRGTTFLFPVEVAYEISDMHLSDEVALITQTADGWRILPDR